MILNLPYIKLPEITGDLEKDAVNLLIQNGHNETAQHCIKVAQIGSELAKRFNLDEEIAYCSGILHDTSTVIKAEDMKTYAENNNWNIDPSEQKYNFILHQRISVVVAKEYFKISDETVLSAIGCHTTLKPNASEYDMILFLADKISWDQNGVPPYLEVINEALNTSLAQACYSYIRFVLDNNMILLPHKWLKEAEIWLKSICVN